jgi:hypothetical protein
MSYLPIKDPIAAILSLVAVTVSLFTFAMNYAYTRRNAILGRRPVLVFEYDGRRGWILRNVGAGPALNVIVAQKRVGGEWFNPVRIPPLAKDGEFVPAWLVHVNDTGLGATYSDVESLRYTSICGDDLTHIHKGKRFGGWTEAQVGRHWNQPPYMSERELAKKDT